MMHSLGIDCTDVLADNSWLLILRYSWIPAGEMLTTVNQFKGALKQLSYINHQNLVHGDFRLANIIFTTDGTSQLIDFDLAGSTTEAYPLQYITSFAERHPDALPEKKRQPEHKISMYSIMTQLFPSCFPYTI